MVQYLGILWPSSLLLALTLGGVSSILFIPAVGLFTHSPIAYQRENRDEYSLAGLSQAQIVLGFNSPHLLGVLIVICPHLLVFVALGIIYSLYFPSPGIAFDSFVAAGIICFGLGSATLLGLARIPFASSRLHIAAAIYGVGLISSPFLLFIALSFLFPMGTFLTNWLPLNSLHSVSLFEAISWLLRGYIVWRAWRRLLRAP